MEYVLRCTPGLPSDYPILLAHKAEGSFEWVAIACRYIADGREVDPISHVRLHHVLSSNPGLGGLYTAILSDGGTTSVAVRLQFLASMIASSEHASMRALLEMSACFPPDVDVPWEVQYLAPILHDGLSNTTVGPCHRSLVEFLCDDKLSGPFHIDSQELLRLRVVQDTSRAIDSGDTIPDLQILKPRNIDSCVRHALSSLEARMRTDLARSPNLIELPPWITATCQFVIHESKALSHHTVPERLHKIFMEHDRLDTFYIAVLDECCCNASLDLVLTLLSLFQYAQEPLLLSTYFDIAARSGSSGIDYAELHRALRPLRSVATGIDDDEAVHCKSSFSSFLRDRSRCGRFFVEPEAAKVHAAWANFCIDEMDRFL